MTNSEARKRTQSGEHPPADTPVHDGPSYADYWPPDGAHPTPSDGSGTDG